MSERVTAPEAAALLNDTARLGSQTFACRFDRFSGNVYTYAPVGWVVGDVLEVADLRLLILTADRVGGVTRIRTQQVTQ